MRTKQRKRPGSGGENNWSNKFAALGNEEERQAEDAVVRKKRREASLCRREEMMEKASDRSLRKK